MSGKEPKKINIFVDDKSYWLFSQWGKMGGSKSREMTCYGRTRILDGKILVTDGYMPKHYGTGGSVDVDNDDLVALMLKLDSEGVPPDEAFRCWVHSHPGTGEKATYLSSTDDDNIDRQLLACDFLVSIVFDSNGGHPFCRFDWKDEKFGRLSTLGNIVLMSGIQASSLDGASLAALDAFRFYNLGKEGIDEAVKIFEEKSHPSKTHVLPGFHSGHNFQFQGYSHYDHEEKKRGDSNRQANGRGSDSIGGSREMGTNGRDGRSLIRAWDWDKSGVSEETAAEMINRVAIEKGDPMESMEAMGDIELEQLIPESDFSADELIEFYNAGYTADDFSPSEIKFLQEVIPDFDDGLERGDESDDGLGKSWNDISQKDFDELVTKSRSLRDTAESDSGDKGIPDWNPPASYKGPTHNED